MREVTVKEAIKELELPCEVRKAPSNIPYILYKDINNKTVAVRRRKADGSLGFWTTLSFNQKVYIYEKDTSQEG